MLVDSASCAPAADCALPCAPAITCCYSQTSSNGAAAQLPAPAVVNGRDGGPSSDAAALASLPLRARLRELLMAGDTAAARQLLQEQAPDLLTAQQPAASSSGSAGAVPGGGGGSFELQFHLACQQYIELIR